MIYDADLMQSLEGLGLAPDPGILAIASATPSDSGIPWSCSSFGLFCNPPAVQNALDTSAFGGSLTQPSKDAATSMAATVIANDSSLAPTNWTPYIIGAVVIGFLLLKR
jgi:hypothetical protein